MLRAVDALIITFLLFLSLVIIIGAFAAQGSVQLILVNTGACATLVLLAFGAETSQNKILRFLHDWYPVPAIFLVFKEVHEINGLLGGADWDPVLIAIDRAIFGTDPTVWLGRFASPVTTEILQIAYASYYFIMLAVGVELFLRKDKSGFTYALFIILYGFFLSYLGYIAFPAVGPRFTLHDFSSLRHELPGLYLTDGIRAILDAGESIPRDNMNAVLFAQRDAFPSGHTELTLISLALASRYALRSRYVLYVCGTLLIIATVYLRYHYVVDLLGGCVLMLFVLWSAPRIFSWWEKLSAAGRRIRPSGN